MKKSSVLGHYQVGNYECSLKPNKGKKYKFQVDFNNKKPPINNPLSGHEGQEVQRRETFVTRKEAEDFIVLLIEELRHGENLVLGFDERVDYKEARKLIDEAGIEPVRIQDIVRDWLSYQTGGSALTLEQCWNQWYELRSAKYRATTLSGHRYTKENALKPFLNLPISEFNKSKYRIALANHLNERWTDRQTLKNQRREVNLFFKWAWKQDMVNAIPLSGKYEFDLPEAKGSGEKEPFILTVDQAEALLKIAYETDKEFGLYNFFCVGLFAGLRTTEIKSLSWDDFILDDEDEDRIYIGGGTKTGRIRQVVMTDQFKEWLALADKSKPFIPKNFTKRRRTLLQLVGLRDGGANSTTFSPLPKEAMERIEHLGLIKERDNEAIDPKNFMRHSCASYMYKSDKKEYTEKFITDNFGHSKTVLHGSYINRRVTTSGANRFLALRPSINSSKVVKFA
jgi:integrase